MRRRFADFAAAAEELPLYRRIAMAAADDDEVMDLLLAAQPGQQRPVLLLAALHDLVLRLSAAGAAPPAARWYASVVGRARLPAAELWDDPGPWRDVRDAIGDHRDELAATMANRTTQTNEVNRSVYVLALLAAVGEEPIALVEFGTSAGLLLTADQYDVRIRDGSPAGLSWGDPRSGVRLAGELRAGGPLRLPPQVVSRIGVDVAPVEPEDMARLRWLQACLWPDVPGRVERFEAAVAQRAALPADRRPMLRCGSMTDPAAIRHALAEAREAVGQQGHVVALTSWALTYVARAERGILPDVLAQESAASGGRVSWATAEPVGAVPRLPELPKRTAGDTQLGLRSWLGGREAPPRIMGLAGPHGQWLQLNLD